MSEQTLALQVLVMPADLNTHGTLFGGTLMGWLDQAGAVIAAGHCGQPIMLAAAHDIDFAQPAFSADQIQIYGEIVKVGTTSIHVQLTAYRRNLLKPKPEVVATGRYVYVTIDKQHKAIPVNKPASKSQI